MIFSECLKKYGQQDDGDDGGESHAGHGHNFEFL